jgi:CHASE2 domain-containing sensor protein
MDDLLAALEALAVGLAIILAVLALLAARRYSERRFAFIGVGLVALGAVSLLGLIDAFWTGAIPNGGLGYPSAVLILFAEAMLYLSLIARPNVPERIVDG